MRYNGLDLLRCILMLLGPLIHVIAVIDPFGNWRYFSELNNNNLIHSIFYPITFFRMETFFIISGFFSLLIFSKKDNKYFLNSRNKRVLIPFFSSLILITPICYFLNFYIYKIFEFNITNTIVHLWFLLTLYIISMIFVFFKEKFRILFNYEKRKVTISLLLLIFFSEILNFLAKKVLGDDFYRYYFYFIYNTIYYLAFFCLGLYFYKFKDTFTCRLKLKHFLITYFVAFLLSYFNYYFIDNFVFKTFYKIFALFFSFIASIYLFNFFKDFEVKASEFLKYFVDKSILIYIFHFPITIYVCYLFDNFIADDLIYFLSTLIIVMVSSIAISHLVSKSNKLSYLFGVKK